jgi:DNA polymerase III delta prime subunit
MTIDNDPELNGKYLGTITTDFAVVSDTLKEASYELRSRKISGYPIFPISRMELPIGKLLLAKEEIATQWDFNFSFLDEFVQRGIIEEDKVEDFKATYKDPDEYCCLFVVDLEFTNFVFIPYPDED